MTSLPKKKRRNRCRGQSRTAGAAIFPSPPVLTVCWRPFSYWRRPAASPSHAQMAAYPSESLPAVGSRIGLPNGGEGIARVSRRAAQHNSPRI